MRLGASMGSGVVTASVSGIDHIESQLLHGVEVVISFHGERPVLPIPPVA